MRWLTLSPDLSIRLFISCETVKDEVYKTVSADINGNYYSFMASRRKRNKENNPPFTEKSRLVFRSGKEQF